MFISQYWPILAFFFSLIFIFLITKFIDYRDENKDLKEEIERLNLKLNEKNKKVDSYEVKELLQDLLSGAAIVEVKRIAPTDVFIRSPREKL